MTNGSVEVSCGASMQNEHRPIEAVSYSSFAVLPTWRNPGTLGPRVHGRTPRIAAPSAAARRTGRCAASSAGTAAIRPTRGSRPSPKPGADVPAARIEPDRSAAILLAVGGLVLFLSVGGPEYEAPGVAGANGIGLLARQHAGPRHGHRARQPARGVPGAARSSTASRRASWPSAPSSPSPPWPATSTTTRRSRRCARRGSWSPSRRAQRSHWWAPCARRSGPSGGEADRTCRVRVTGAAQCGCGRSRRRALAPTAGKRSPAGNRGPACPTL